MLNSVEGRSCRHGTVGRIGTVGYSVLHCARPQFNIATGLGDMFPGQFDLPCSRKPERSLKCKPYTFARGYTGNPVGQISIEALQTSFMYIATMYMIPAAHAILMYTTGIQTVAKIVLQLQVLDVMLILRRRVDINSGVYPRVISKWLESIEGRSELQLQAKNSGILFGNIVFVAMCL